MSADLLTFNKPPFMRVALLASTVEAVAETDTGCVIYTKRGVHHVQVGYDEAVLAIWPKKRD